MISGIPFQQFGDSAKFFCKVIIPDLATISKEKVLKKKTRSISQRRKGEEEKRKLFIFF